jgi:tetratricopeptide (TPR) repeat protein
MSDWRNIWKRAEAVRDIAITDNDISYFNGLLAEYPKDGMVHLQLGKAYKALGEKDDAIKEFKIAESLLVMPKWKAIAREEITSLSEQEPSVFDKDDIVIF